MKSKKSKKTIQSIQCVWGLLCSLSSVDQERNNISLFNVIDQVSLPSGFFIEQKNQNKPLSIPLEHEVVILWKRTLGIEFSDEQLSLAWKLKVIDPIGKVIYENFISLILKKGAKRLRSRVKMNGFIATIPGQYVYRIELVQSEKEDFTRVFEIPVDVLQN